MKYIYIEHGEATVRKWETRPTEEALQELLGGCFEVYKIAGLADHTMSLWINEMGKPEQLPINFFWEQMGDIVRGPALITAVDWDGEITGLTEEDIATVSVALPPGAKIIPRLEIVL